MIKVKFKNFIFEVPCKDKICVADLNFETVFIRKEILKEENFLKFKEVFENLFSSPKMKNIEDYLFCDVYVYTKLFIIKYPASIFSGISKDGIEISLGSIFYIAKEKNDSDLLFELSILNKFEKSKITYLNIYNKKVNWKEKN